MLAAVFSCLGLDQAFCCSNSHSVPWHLLVLASHRAQDFSCHCGLQDKSRSNSRDNRTASNSSGCSLQASACQCQAMDVSTALFVAAVRPATCTALRSPALKLESKAAQSSWPCCRRWRSPSCANDCWSTQRDLTARWCSHSSCHWRTQTPLSRCVVANGCAYGMLIGSAALARSDVSVQTAVMNSILALVEL